jgi:hypothetical protein
MIVLSLGAHLTSRTEEELDFIAVAVVLAIVTAGTTLVSVMVMRVFQFHPFVFTLSNKRPQNRLIIGMTRKGAFSSLVVAELAGLGKSEKVECQVMIVSWYEIIMIQDFYGFYGWLLP